MELKDFIKTAIRDVTEAVSELQQELKNDAVINPILFNSEPGKTLLVENKVRMIERLNFDIAVTATDESGIGGSGKAGISVFGARVGAEKTEKTDNISRLTFSIPVIMPSTYVRTPSEVARDSRPVHTS